MTANLTKAAVAAVLFLTVVIGASRAQSPSEGDSAAIRQTVAKMGAAFNRHDAHALAALFAEDADFTNLRGMSRHSRKDIEAFLVPLFGGVLKNATRTDSIRSIRMLTPTLAAVDTDDTITTDTKTADGSDSPPRKGLMSLILTKQRSQWLVAIFHEQDFAPAPPAVPASK